MDDDYDDPHDAGWFEDELRQRDRLIAELRSERDEQSDLIRRGSIESVWRCPSHFRFIPHSRHLLGDTAGPFRASGGHGAYELTPALPAVSWDRSARFATMFSNAVMRTVELRRH